MTESHPPTPGPVVQPNFLAVLEALGEVTFPISKRDLLDQVDGTVMLDGRNVELRELIKDIHDDFFDDEDELQRALEREYPRPHEGQEPPLADTEKGVLPTGAAESWQSRTGPGESGAPSGYVEPSSE